MRKTKKPLYPPVSLASRHTLPLTEVLVPWKPRFRMSIPPQYPRLAAAATTGAGRIWSAAGSIEDFKLAASVTFMGQGPSEPAKQRMAVIRGAAALGFKLTRYQHKGFTLLTLVREKSILTEAGGQGILSGLFERPEVAKTGHHERDFAARRLADAKILARWMATLPETTLQSPSAFATKLNLTAMGQHFEIQRDFNGSAYLAARDNSWRFYESDGGRSYAGSLRALLHYAAGDADQHSACQGRAAEKAAIETRDMPLTDLLEELGFAALEPEPA